MSVSPPKSFDDAAVLLDSSDLPGMLKQRLIQLVFKDGIESVSFRAIELLLAMPRHEDEDELDSFSDLELIKKLYEHVAGEKLDF